MSESDGHDMESQGPMSAGQKRVGEETSDNSGT